MSAAKSKPVSRHWSYSAWSVYASCKLKYKYQYVERRKTETTYAMARGTDAHAKAEQFLLGNIKGFPLELSKLRGEFTALRKAKPRVEEWVKLRADWTPASKDEPAWFIGRVDAMVVSLPALVVIDHKTGKFRPSHFDQGDLYATAVSALEPAATEISWEFWYLDYGEVKRADVSTRRLSELRGTWHERGMQVVTETKFPAQPSKFGCNYCDFRSDRGGPCAAWKKI